jgi:predicted site-specific integrase-resolvase
MESGIELLSREDAAKELNVTTWTILRWQKRGLIAPTVDRGERGIIRYLREEVERVRASHQKRHRWAPAMAS